MEVLFVAGEASGDLHAAGVAAALKARRPDLAIAGVGGTRMREAGVDIIADIASTAVMGFVEVLTHIPRHYALLRTLRARWRTGTVGLLVCVDYPGFNLRLAAAAHEAGIPVLYYITPQVWAWGARRLAQMARVVSRAAVILPFETPLLRAHGIDATFVGHPLLDGVGHDAGPGDRARGAWRWHRTPACSRCSRGSRAQEVARHLDPFVAAARAVERRQPGITVLISESPGNTIDRARCPYQVVSGGSLALLSAADAALCKSGTTTLEAAVAGCPLVVAYRMNSWTYAIARRLVTIPHIGLVNVVAGREVAREFVQDAILPDAVADALVPLLDPTSSERARMLWRDSPRCASRSGRRVRRGASRRWPTK